MNRFRTRWTTICGRGSVTAATMVWLAMANAPAEAQVQSKAQRKCIATMNDSAAMVVKAQFAVAQKCLIQAAAGKLLAGQSAQQCLTADNAGKLFKATSATTDKEASACVAPLPDFGYTDAATVNAAALGGALGTFTDLFGADLDAAIIEVGTDKVGAKCQSAMAKATAKVVGAMLGELRACKNAGLVDESVASSAALATCLDAIDADVKDKIGKALSKVSSTFATICFDTSQALAFPGECSSEASMPACLETAARCRSCKIFEGADAISGSCDLFDDNIANASCPGCTDGDSDTYGIGCDAGEDCDDTDADVNPAAQELCNGADDDCDSMIDEFPVDVGTSCGATDIGPCALGTNQCMGGTLTCLGATGPQMETCNGIDDDCDGDIDLAAGSEPTDSLGSCDAGVDPPMGTTSACMAGTLACDGGVVVCQGSIPPSSSVDTCMIDANCDGMLTNQPDIQADVANCGGCGNDCYSGSVHSTWSCASGSCQFEGCAAGFFDLNGDHLCEYACTFLSSQEACNGIDDDCDGVIDEDVVSPSPTQVCGTSPAASSAECTSLVTVSCDGGSWDCQFPVGVCTTGCGSTAEICDALDNDCDGLLNENVPLYGTACASDEGFPPPGHGACRTTGTHVCTSANSTACSATKAACASLPGGCTETCDGIDQDCNFMVDDGLIGCTFPPDACDNIDNNGNGVVDEGCAMCGSPLHLPQAETCNGQDDDCDGFVDEVGVCGGCVPEPEICDGCDNDCDGIADDGVASVPCGSSSPANCTGVLACKPPQAVVPGGCVAGGGYLSCSNTPQAESCDGLDNDCDGTADDNLASGSCEPEGAPSGLIYGGSSQCRLGQTQCIGGTAPCSGWVGPSSETCDGVDNDCDGIVDESVVGVGEACGTNQSPCSQGVIACVGAALVCQGGVHPQAEICDGLDNNCNGSVDEFPLADAPAPGQAGCWTDAGSACTHGPLSWSPPAGASCSGDGSLTQPCHHGALTCSSGAWTCQSAAGPSAEACDGLDNDCDGSIDEGGSLCAEGLGCQSGLCRP